MTGQPIMECRFCGRDDLTPQGHKSHETHCDENPNPGIPYDQQQQLDLIESQEGARNTDESPNPDQSVAGSSEGLPSVKKLGERKNDDVNEPVADGGERQCPLCGHDDVLEAADAKEAYISAVDKPHPKAVLGYELADWACQNPECAALWGSKYHEPLPMDAVISA